MLRVTGAQREAKSAAAGRNSPKVVRFERRPVQFPGIVEAAKALGVHRVHLWQVLSGRRQSKALLARYHALKRAR